MTRNVWLVVPSSAAAALSVAYSSFSHVHSAHGSRAEDAGTNEAYREQFDVATARAVAEVRTLAELCLPLVKVGGYWVAPKGPDPEDEVRDGLRAIETLGGEVNAISVERLGAEDDEKPEFTVVTVPKRAATPPQYPRRANAMKKRPL